MQVRPKFEKTKDQAKAVRLIAFGKQFITLLFGGSRSGKTAILVRSIIVRALKTPSRHVILRHKFNHLKQSIIMDTFPKMMRLAFPHVVYELNRTDWFVRFGNGSEIWFGGLDDADRVEKILGNEYSTVFLNEISQISYHGVTTIITRLAEKNSLKKMLWMDCNPPAKSHWSYKLFFLHRDPQTNEAVDPDDYAQMRLNPDGNTENLDPLYLERLAKLPHRQRKRFLLGEFVDDVLGALWKQETLDTHRVTHEEISANDLDVIEVAIDPATTSGEDAAETGIMVGGTRGEGEKKHAYLLEDLSGVMSPNAWATAAVAAYHQYNANRIVAEKNQGGEMVRATIHSIDSSIPVKLVHASKGKIVRADPVSHMYEAGRIHHVGYFGPLEEQLTEYTGKPSEKSPDRMDACVWLMTSLMVYAAVEGVDIDPISLEASFFNENTIA